MPHDCVVCNQHRSLLEVPGLNVCGQLEFAVLNVVVQAAPMREKPSPGTARCDQMAQTRPTSRHECVIIMGSCN